MGTEAAIRSNGKERRKRFKAVAHTERGTPVYLLDEPIPEEIVPPEFRKKRGLGVPEPKGDFARWLNRKYPRSSIIIVRYRRFTRLIKIGKAGDVFSVTARSVLREDRERLIRDGLLNRT